MVPLSPKEIVAHSKVRVCHICLRPFKKEDRKVRDHCHYTRKYRGVAHSNCNLQYKIPGHIPVIFHNLSGYDAHLFIKELGKHMGRMSVIAKNKEDYISFSIKVEVRKKTNKYGLEVPVEMDLRFINSYRFMGSSLDSLINNLSRGGHKFRGFMGYTQWQRSILVKKGVYPYEYMDSWEKFEEDRLPPIKKFYSRFNMLGISDEDYVHVKKVWVDFGLRNLGEYHDLYLRTNVILLSNVF